jgi:Yip1 domain
MANTTVQTGASPAPKSLVARVIGIITSPRATYEAVVAHPKWFGMLALCAVGLGVLIGGFLMTKVGQDAWLDAALNSPFSGQVSDQQIQAMEKMAPYVGYGTVVYMLVLIPIFMVILSGILYAVFNAAMGGNATFKQVFTVVVHAGPIGLLSQLFTVPLNYFRGTMTSATTLAVLLPMLPDKSFAGRLLGMIDLFLIWQLIVLSIGLAVLYRRRTQPIATALLVVYFIIAVIVAFVRRGAGA